MPIHKLVTAPDWFTNKSISKENILKLNLPCTFKNRLLDSCDDWKLLNKQTNKQKRVG